MRPTYHLPRFKRLLITLLWLLVAEAMVIPSSLFLWRPSGWPWLVFYLLAAVVGVLCGFGITIHCSYLELNQHIKERLEAKRDARQLWHR